MTGETEKFVLKVVCDVIRLTYCLGAFLAHTGLHLSLA